jgi:predicted PurR-regulated permease PerM
MPLKFFSTIWFTLILSIAIAFLIFIACQKFFDVTDSIVVSLCITIIITLMTQKVIAEKEVKKEAKEEASAIIAYVDKQDRKIIDSLNQHIEESNNSNETVMNYIKSIDSKLDSLLSR